MYNRAAGIEILNYGITRLGNWRGAGGMRQRYGAENPGGGTAWKIRAAVLLETGKGKEKVMKKSLVVLAFGTLGLGIAEFGMMSILSAAAEGLGISIAKAGHLISAYALGVCFGAVALVFLSRGKPLKTLLIALMAVMCAGNLLAVFAPNYELMMMARFISGLPHGGYFGVAGIAAKKLAARGKEVEAVSVMISGMTVANLLGIPMASYLTHIMSWHMLFAVVAAWGLFTIYAIREWVPDIAPLPATNFRAQFAFLQKPQPWLLLATIMLGNGGLFCWYSYINPIMVETAGFPFYYMAGIMMLAGLGMVLGNFVSGRLSLRVPAVELTMAMIGLMFLASAGILLLAPQPYVALALMFFGVFGLFGVSSPEQSLIIDTAKGGEILGASGAQVAFNLAMRSGLISAVCRLPRDMRCRRRQRRVRPYACWGWLRLIISAKGIGGHRRQRRKTGAKRGNRNCGRKTGKSEKMQEKNIFALLLPKVLILIYGLPNSESERGTYASRR